MEARTLAKHEVTNLCACFGTVCRVILASVRQTEDGGNQREDMPFEPDSKDRILIPTWEFG